MRNRRERERQRESVCVCVSVCRRVRRRGLKVKKKQRKKDTVCIYEFTKGQHGSRTHGEINKLFLIVLSPQLYCIYKQIHAYSNVNTDTDIQTHVERGKGCKRVIVDWIL